MKSLRTTTSVLLTAGLTLLPVTPIPAATPAFALEAYVDRTTIHVTVTFERVPMGFAWGSLEASGVLDELVGLIPADLVDDGRPLALAEPVLISLRRIDEGIYTGTARVAEGGWAIVAWPLDTDSGSAAEFVTVGASSTWLWVIAGSAAALVIAALSLLGVQQLRECGCRWTRTH